MLSGVWFTEISWKDFAVFFKKQQSIAKSHYITVQPTEEMCLSLTASLSFPIKIKETAVNDVTVPVEMLI